MTAGKWVLIGTIALGAVSVAGGASAQERGGFGFGPARGAPPSFESLDANGDGTVTIEEFRAHAAARLAEADTNGDGVLSEEELIAQIEARRAERIKMMVEMMIRWRDVDGDGALSPAELSAGSGQKLFQRVDTNHDGAISQEEFDTFLKMRQEHRGKFKRGPRQGG